MCLGVWGFSPSEHPGRAVVLLQASTIQEPGLAAQEGRKASTEEHQADPDGREGEGAQEDLGERGEGRAVWM